MNIVVGKTLAHARGLIELLNLSTDDWAPVSVETEYAIRGLTVTNVLLAAELSHEQERDLGLAWRDSGFVLKYQTRDDFLDELDDDALVAKMVEQEESFVGQNPSDYSPLVIHIPVELLEKIRLIEFKD